MRGRHVIIVTARGGVYDPGTPSETWDHVVPPLRILFTETLDITASPGC